MEAHEYFYSLTPDQILDSIEKLGLSPTGRFFQLNSMENRVFEIEIEEEPNFIVAKYYRPGRWSREQIKEEHSFIDELNEVEIPVIPYIKRDGESLFEIEEHNLYYAISKRQRGRAPEELGTQSLQILGRTLGRLHRIGKSRSAPSRLNLNPQTYGTDCLNLLLEKKLIPAQYLESYSQLVQQIVAICTPLFSQISMQRVHGDCHKGNVIVRDDLFYFIDFDDMCIGPAIQDLWLLLPDQGPEGMRDRSILLEAYQQMNEFNMAEIKLIEPLRALRLIHFNTWVAKRFEDPSFKLAFPQFGTDHYWQEQILFLREQIGSIYDSGTEYGYS